MNQKELCVAGVVAVAGLSSRMGDFKPLLPCGNSTIIQTTIASLQQAGAFPIVVVVGHRGGEIKKLISKMDGVQVLNNPNYQNGEMLESIQLGLAQVSGCDAAFVLPGDMPAISRQTFELVRHRMLETGACVVFPTLEGRLKHPPLIRKDCFQAICNFKQEGGLRAALNQFQENTQYVPVDDFGCTLDADTPEEYRELLCYQNRTSAESKSNL